ncbi:hypothetical protein BT96DRAFT_39979 [Gymnopus androsaceus JB14]|uniref:Uncharacterized protein n=1 Tax=Gymnopus androsaceus JB14 TaxID=1447944 RepID=A0A6A4GDK7_9AGAR|nr:hypothetical protein BT96DRAFT_39979 [Gymnopus androsaceus JB14]
MAADIDTSSENVGNLGETFNAVLDKVALFNKVIDGIGEIHPYVKMVTTIITGITKPLENQMKRDEDMKDLLTAIGEVYEFLKANIKDPKHLNKHQTHLAQLLILQTNDGHESGSGTGTCRYTGGNTRRYLTCGSRYLFPTDPAQVTGHPLGYF